MSDTKSGANAYAMTVDQIRKFLPHRAPFLLVDRILEIDPKGDLANIAGSDDKIGTRVVGLKNVTYNEPAFMGHFPEYSIFPGVLMVEAMAQVASFTAYPYLKANPAQLEKGFGVILVGVDGVRFRRPITPGDSVRIEARLVKCRSSLWCFDVQALVDGQKVAQAEIMANLNLN